LNDMRPRSMLAGGESTGDMHVLRGGSFVAATKLVHDEQLLFLVIEPD